MPGVYRGPSIARKGAAMALVTFKLNDFGIASMANLAPRAYLIPEGPAVVATNPVDYLLSSKRVRMTLAPDGVTFSASVFPTSWTRPVTHMRLLLEWHNTDGARKGTDPLPWRFFIPVSDANLSDLIDVAPTEFMAWIGPTPQDDPVVGAWWLNSVTGDLAEWGGDVVGWEIKTNLTGIEGRPGPAGPPGPNAQLVSDDPKIPAMSIAAGSFSKWRAAVAAALAGGPAAKLLIVGDSTAQGAVTVPGSWPTALIGALTRRGLKARSGIVAPATNIPDPRWNYASWLKPGDIGPGGGLWFGNSAAVGVLKATPGVPFTDIAIHYLCRTGSGSSVVKNGATTLFTINGVADGPNNAYRSKTAAIAGTAATAISIEAPTGGGLYVLGFEAVDSANPSVVAVHNWAQSGTTTQQWTTLPVSLGAITYLTPALTLIMLGINDSIAGESSANYLARMTTLINTAKASGDVMVVTNPRSDPAFSAGIGTLQAAYEVAIVNYCRENSIPVFDLYERLGPWTAASSGPWWRDQVHQSDLTNQDIAQVLAGILA